MRWTERAFHGGPDGGSAPARLVVLTALGLGDVCLLHRPQDATDLVIALTGFAACVAGCLLPPASRAAPAAPVAPVALAALLVLGDVLGAHAAITLKAMIAFTLFELALRPHRGRVLAAVAVLVAALLCAHAVGTAGDVPPTLFRLSVLIGVPLLLGSSIRLARENARRAREAMAEQERRRRSETLAARAAERTVIARELHDLVAHHVSSMVLRVGIARHVLPSADPRVTEVLDDLHASGASALADLRHLVAVLRDPGLVQGEPGVSLVERAGLPAALEAALERGRRAGLAIDAAIDPQVTGLDAVRRLTVLRIVQEGLANVARHAGPGTSAELSVRVDGQAVRLEIADDGAAGPGPSGGPIAPFGPSGHGLAGMTERVELLGGTLAAGPRERGGWRLLAEIPAPAPAPDPAPESEPSEPSEPSGRAA
ncbi:two-component sensor histidine kinase [Actinomadura graeca]|uniref:histidine kinase n=1 Tax=Actinomadura graeca TaxID=2750812 RepID=A0ABX8R6X5_9ACTN|nr:histidine kinase [Actinomadura graeca]QXJ26834.1 two-component sensor histidine kinase [Actinomadura graeca]